MNTIKDKVLSGLFYIINNEVALKTTIAIGIVGIVACLGVVVW